MESYGSLCDDFYVNMSLNTEMELPQQRGTVLPYMERVQRQYPTMRNFFCRDKGDFVLEEDKDGGQYRWTTVEPRQIRSGVVNPDTVEQALDQHRLILDLAPPYLTISPLDCEALDLLFGFDFTYRGNHNHLVAEALGVSPSLERLLEIPGANVVGCEPAITLALDEACRLQCRLSIETRTNAYQIRTAEYPEEQLSVYLTARQYGSLPAETKFSQTLDQLAQVCEELIDQHVVENVLRPLQRAIAMK